MSLREFLLAVGFAFGFLVASWGPALSNSDEEQLARMADPDQWPAPGRDFALTRHSTLVDIDTSNVSKLQMIWLQGTNALRGHEGQPLAIKDVGGKTLLFMVSGCPSMSNCNVVQALDLTDPDNPKQVWSYVKASDRDETAILRTCCDTVNRGGSYADGKFVFGTLDGFVIALDGQTGKEVWVVKHAYPEAGETITPAPLIADDKVIIGFSGDEFAARGRVAAYSLKDGSEVWTCHSTGSDKDVCVTPDTNKANPQYGQAGEDLGIKTFPGEDYRIGGGAAWGWYSYDPKLKLVYYSTGSPGLWSPQYRCPDKTHEQCNTGEFDNKWSATIFARKVSNGEAVWAYQMTPFDQWDYAGINENVLTDMDIDGKKVKALTHFDRNGFAYVLDRTDGTLLRATKYVTTDWAEKIDMKTGRPIKVREHSPLEVGRNVSACPSAMGGKDQQPGSVDPKEPNIFYMPTNNWCMELEPQERTHTNQGTVYVFANVYMYPEKQGTTGKIKKYDVLTGKTIWESPDPYPNWGGTMVTDGGLVFYGSLGGDFRAVDRNSSKLLWSRKLGSGIIGSPITYKVGGRQYVAVYSGIGGWIGLPVTAGLDLNDKFGAIGATAMTMAAGLRHIPQGGQLNVFTVVTTRAFAGPLQYSPSEFFIYGMLAFRSRAASYDRSMHQFACAGYLNVIEHFYSYKGIPSSQQAITVWPIESDADANQLNREPRTEALCERAIDGYGLSAARQAIREAESVRPELIGQKGPFLIAWSPGKDKGRAKPIITDFSDMSVYEHAKEALEKWIQDLVDPDILSRDQNGWDLEKVRLKLQYLADKYGPMGLKVYAAD